MTNGISAINNIGKNSLINPTDNQKAKSGNQFSDVLANALSQVSQDVKTAETLNNQLAAGEVKDLHQVTIAMEKASLGVEMTVQVRNKVVEAYQEIMRMQI